MIIGVVGLGYVGLPLAVAFAEAGDTVIGVDVDQRKVRELAAGRSHIEDIPDERLTSAVHNIETTTDFGELNRADAVLICVPTPLNVNREPDLGPMISAAKALSPALRRDQVIVLESTTYPGTTREDLAPLLQADSGLIAGEDYALAFSPERVDPGRTDYTIRNTPKVIGGLTPGCTRRACDLYSRVCDQVVPVSSPEAAEMSKLLENIFRSVNIALVNELAMVADRMDIDVWEVIEAAATKPFGFMRFEPGPGMGGHCLPVDPFYLTWKAREYDMPTEFIELAGKVNTHMPYFCVERIERALNSVSKAVRGSRVLLMGVAYKPGVGDMRESPALKIIRLLRERGAEISYHDPHVPALESFGLRSAELEPALVDAELVVIVTAHPEIDHAHVARTAALTLDLRGATRDVESATVSQL